MRCTYNKKTMRASKEDARWVCCSECLGLSAGCCSMLLVASLTSQAPSQCYCDPTLTYWPSLTFCLSSLWFQVCWLVLKVPRLRHCWGEWFFLSPPPPPLPPFFLGIPLAFPLQLPSLWLLSPSLCALMPSCWPIYATCHKIGLLYPQKIHCLWELLRKHEELIQLRAIVHACYISW